jgi:pilus assembly protein FimV
MASKAAEDGLDFDFGGMENTQTDNSGADLLSTLPGMGDQPSSQGLSLDFTTSEFTAPVPVPSEPAPSDFDLSIDLPEEEPQEAPSAPLAAPSLDFSGIDLDLSQAEAQPDPAPAVEQDMDMTLSDFGMAFESTSAEASAAEATRELEATLSGLDFSPAALPEEVLDFAAPEPEAEQVSPTSEPEEGLDPALHEEVETKLDLARAYLEMGDKEGAREILEEVLAEGDGAQKGKAEKLLAEAA